MLNNFISSQNQNFIFHTPESSRDLAKTQPENFEKKSYKSAYEVNESRQQLYKDAKDAIDRLRAHTVNQDNWGLAKELEATLTAARKLEGTKNELKAEQFEASIREKLSNILKAEKNPEEEFAKAKETKRKRQNEQMISSMRSNLGLSEKPSASIRDEDVSNRK